MNREAFFTALRKRDSGLFGTSLSPKQKAGIESILDAVEGELTDVQHVANVLAQVYRETGGYMSPIKETVMPWHKDKNPSDAEVIRRLDRAWAKGQLKGVKAPYWRDGEFGRGQLQVTHRDNRLKLAAVTGIDFGNNRDLLLDPKSSAIAAVAGMKFGIFRGKKLADYKFPDALDAPPSRNPRRIVNGNDGSDREVAQNHRVFLAALEAAGWGAKPRLVPQERPAPLLLTPQERPVEARPASQPTPAPTSPPTSRKTGAAKGSIAALVVGAVALFIAKWAEFNDWIASLWPF